MRIDLLQLHPNQSKVLKNAKRFNVVNCGRRWGKSAMAENLCAEIALDGHPVGYFAPTYKLLQEMWRNLLFRLQPIVTEKSTTSKTIRLSTGGVIEFWTMDDPNAGRSRKYKRVILDECAMTRHLEEVWLQSVRPTLTDLKGDAWFLSTPKGHNFFHNLYAKALAGEKDWACWQMPTSSNPFIDKGEIEEARRELPELIFKQEYEADFAQSEMNPFGHDYIEGITIDKLSTNPTDCFGIDVAFKNDWTVIIGLDSAGVMTYFERFQRPLPETQERIKNVVGTAAAYMDSTGLGQPMFQALRDECNGLEGLTYTGGKGDNSKYRLINHLINAVQKAEIRVLRGVVTEEMKNFEYTYTPNGTIQYNAPTGLHDDCINALALAYKAYEEVQFAPRLFVK